MPQRIFDIIIGSRHLRQPCSTGSIGQSFQCVEVEVKPGKLGILTWALQPERPSEKRTKALRVREINAAGDGRWLTGSGLAAPFSPGVCMRLGNQHSGVLLCESLRGVC